MFSFIKRPFEISIVAKHFMANMDIFLTDLRIFGQILSWRVFLHFFTFLKKNPQHNFIKGGGEGERPFINFIKNRRFFTGGRPNISTAKRCS